MIRIQKIQSKRCISKSTFKRQKRIMKRQKFLQIFEQFTYHQIFIVTVNQSKQRHKDCNQLVNLFILIFPYFYNNKNSDMIKETKGNKSRPKLLIQIEDFQKKVNQFKNQQGFNGVDVKPLRSAKNVHQMKKFEFDDEGVDVCHTARKISKLKKLEQQKVNLIQSLEILKESAVSAIAQKQDEIEKLKLKTSFIQDDNIELFEQRLYEQRCMRINLEDEKDQLLKQLKQERQLHISQLEEKQRIIDQLCEEISEIRNQIEMLQQSDLAKSKKIKLLLQENQQLSEQLEISSIATALKQRSQQIIDLDETIKLKPALSVASSIQSKRYHSYFSSSEHYFQSEIDKSYITQKLQQAERTHKEELLDLRTFYEKRIIALRQIYERQLHLPTQSSEGESVTRPRKGSNCSKSQKSCKRNGSKKQIEGLQINLKEMYSIEENVQNQLETSRSNLQNLRNQIRMQNLSECPSVEPRFNTNNEDAESQFTTKYFEVPNRFLKKNQSSDSITINHDIDIKIVAKKVVNEAQSQKACSRKPSEVDISNKRQPLSNRKQCIFGAGLLSGIALSSLVGYFFTKKSF